MRLGCIPFTPQRVEDIASYCDKLDCHGLSAIAAPKSLLDMTPEECARYGEEARRHGLVIGEYGYWENLLTDDPALRALRLKRLRTALVNADAMGCRSVATLVGTKHPSDRAYDRHAYLFTQACRREFAEIVLRALDGLDLTRTRYGIEPYCHSFFYRPAEAREFIDRVDHPSFGIHLDLVNMISHETYFHTDKLADEAFALLADRIVSVHLKDLHWEETHLGMKWHEVPVGDGTMDFHAYLTHVSRLDPDMTCFCEHYTEERDYALNFARLHHRAKKAGLAFLPRGQAL
jgi:sugar phosphate isomerase/epimerase